MTLDELRAKIKATRPTVDKLPYSHNIINLCLAEIADKHGDTEAEKAIKDFKLAALGWPEHA